MEEFKTIPDAPDYTINKEGEVKRTNGTTVFHLADRMVILKKKDGLNGHFSVDDLVGKLFTITTIKPTANDVNDHPLEESSVSLNKEREIKEENETNESEDKNLIKEDIEPTAIEENPKNKTRGRKKKSEVISSDKSSAEIEHILNLDEFDRVKICKLHLLGCTNNEILFHLKKPKSSYASVAVTISQYKADKKLQERIAGIK